MAYTALAALQPSATANSVALVDFSIYSPGYTAVFGFGRLYGSCGPRWLSAFRLNDYTCSKAFDIGRLHSPCGPRWLSAFGSADPNAFVAPTACKRSS